MPRRCSLGLRSDSSCRLVFLGAPLTGKSCLVSRCLGRAVPSHYEPTGDDLYLRNTRCSCGCNDLLLEVVDIGGETEFPAMREQLISTADVFAITFSLDDKESFREAKKIYKEVRAARGRDAAPVVLVASKSDVLAEGDPLVSFLSNRAQRTAVSWACEYVETSARNGTGISELIDKALPIVCRNCQNKETTSFRRSSSPSRRRWRLSESSESDTGTSSDIDSCVQRRWSTGSSAFDESFSPRFRWNSRRAGLLGSQWSWRYFWQECQVVFARLELCLFTLVCALLMWFCKSINQ